MKNMNYNDALDFLFSQLPAYHRIGKAAYKNNLDNTLLLDGYTGHPHNKFMTVHIAGTNGKGSVSHMLASILQEAGYKTGLYTSPHLRDFRERIKINGKMISHEAVTDFVNRYRNVIESVSPSFFEMTVAMAFDYFASEHTDIAIIETGLGGRLDSTNIINPLLSVITNIGHDHMDLLGDTLVKIAAEKAGIIKKGVPVVIGESQVETAEVFIQKSIATNSKIEFADRNFICQLENGDLLKGERKYMITDNCGNVKLKGISALGGDYQGKNLVTVFQSMISLGNNLHFSEDDIRNGIRNVISNTGLEGRWQVLGQKPLTICDTGHNKEGLEYVLRQLADIAQARLHLIIGFVNDKDLSLALPLFPVEASYYFTKASVARAMDENILMTEAQKYGLNGNSYPDVVTAMKAAAENAAPDDVIFIGGSTFIVADCLNKMNQ
jgi:dihydrofolate synthase/folylpolyglutamate synthase